MAAILFSADLEVGQQTVCNHTLWPHRLLVLWVCNRLYFPLMAKPTYLSHFTCFSYNMSDIPFTQELGVCVLPRQAVVTA